jgi:ribosomal protein L11 methyltransferase
MVVNPMSNPITQHRHYLITDQQLADDIYHLLDAEFEEDGIPVSLFEEDEEKGLWNISIYTQVEDSVALKARMVGAIGDLGSGNDDETATTKVQVKTEIIGETDWIAETLRQLSPVSAGRFVVHGSHDKGVVGFNQIAIEIDAGLAFGTGHHGTTAGCLEMLGRELKRQTFCNPLDLGTGSGVLAIGLAKATKTKVLATDIDAVATYVTGQNAKINSVHNLVTARTATGFNHREITARAPFDLIIANILARPLQKMAADFGRHAAPGATIILSGLLPHQKARIIAAFQIQGIHFIKAHIREGWLTLVLRA